MGAETKIEWANYTFNHLRGCSKVDHRCFNCYADQLSKRNPKTLGQWGPNGTRVVAAESYWKQPAKWNRDAAGKRVHDANGCGSVVTYNREGRGRWQCPIHGECATDELSPLRPGVFCASLADVFEDWQGPMVDCNGKHLVHGIDEWIPEDNDQAESCSRVTMQDVRERLFRLIDATSNIDWLLLTKRPENVLRMWPLRRVPHPSGDAHTYSGRNHRHNVWLGTSCSDQETADVAIPELLKCRDRAPVLFLSIEPLLGPVDLSGYLANNSLHSAENHERVTGHECDRFRDSTAYWATCRDCGKKFEDQDASIDWVIVGGESGHHARPCNVAWIRSIVRQCREAGVPCFCKQLGSNPVVDNAELAAFGNEVAPDLFPVKHPKGGDPEEWPNDLRVMEMPSR